MRLLKTSLAIAVLAASTSSIAAESFNAKSLAMSGSGLAVSDFSYGTALNPALGSNYDASDDFNMNFNVGAIGSDPDDLIDKGDEIVDLIDALDGTTINSQSDIERIQDLNNKLGAISGLSMSVDAGGSFEVAIPNKYAATTFFARGSAVVKLTPMYNELDETTIENIITNNGTFDADDLDTQMIAKGASIVEVGLNFATKFKLGEQTLSVGIAPKYQTVETINYVADIQDFDEDNFDADNFTTDDSNFNLDIGVQTQYNNWKFGAVAKNLIENEYKVINGSTITVEPQISLGVGYKNDWAQISFDLDATAAEDFSTSQDVQLARFGLALDAWDTLQLRAGYRHDLEGVYDDTISAGLGISPFDVLNIDLAVVTGDNDTIGGALQVGLSF